MKLKIIVAGLLAATGLAAAGAVALASTGPTPVNAATQWQLAATALPSAALSGIARAEGAASLSGTPQAGEVTVAGGLYAGILFDQDQFSATAGDPQVGVSSVKPFESLNGLTFIDNSLSILTLSQSPAPDGSVGAIYGAGVVKAPATSVELVLEDGTTVSVPTIPAPDGLPIRVFAFLADDPARFPTAVESVGPDGATLGSFKFDPTSHP